MIYRFVTRASVEERITQVRSAVHYNKCYGKYLFYATKQSIVSSCYSLQTQSKQ